MGRVSIPVVWARGVGVGYGSYMSETDILINKAIMLGIVIGATPMVMAIVFLLITGSW
jgi:hypothetical protein